MRKPSKFLLRTALFAAILILGTSANADTIATFADPVPNGGVDYLFEFDGDTLDGGWQGTGLTLITPINSGSYDDVTFTMTTLDVDLTGETTGGVIEFMGGGGGGGGDGVPLLRITFDHAQLSVPFGVGASSLVTGHNVVFSGQIISGELEREMFAFSFANQQEVGAGFTWSAAFTSSAIPEPATLTLILVGGLLTVFNRRNS